MTLPATMSPLASRRYRIPARKTNMTSQRFCRELQTTPANMAATHPSRMRMIPLDRMKGHNRTVQKATPVVRASRKKAEAIPAVNNGNRERPKVLKYRNL